MILGFTGTRNPPTNAQIAWLYGVFETSTDIESVHHGACVGADALCHKVALENKVPIVVHPPTNPRLIAPECLIKQTGVIIYPSKPYLHRNRDIADLSTGLIALPSEPESTSGGGTWYTVHWAYDRLNKPVVICSPNGVVEQRYARAENRRETP